ncbi:Periplasmic zinc-binding protein TroA precursor [Rubinisphaera italica]|uniref:Periplasmic zinc-binding protein TroA n=2 Tax=Rubinisphaera italica TaxID=2527969 RepID=A0A5C5XMU6_9PLAN|nr:Periplasmic zinc-binding protein TroA precursor [Rubinisphaera italica]
MIFAVFGPLFAFGCNGTSNTETGSTEPRPLKIVLCTTGMVGDLVSAILGPEVEVNVLMKAGVDPHLFTPSPRDISLMSQADAIIYNGLHLEAGLSQTLEHMEQNKKQFVYALATGLTTEDGLIEVAAGKYDPHFWNDLELWQVAARKFADSLGERYPDQAEAYNARAAQYCDQIQLLLDTSREQIEVIPENGRILISAHDAFEYFGRSLGLEVAAVQGISTNAEASVKKVEVLVSRVVDNRIPAIFAESSVSDKSIQAIIAGCKQRGFDVQLGGTLFSDALGPAGSGAETFPTMFAANVKTIVDALNTTP